MARRGTIWLTVLALAGCGSPTGGKLTLFPEGHKLIAPARELRDHAGPPDDPGRELDKVVAEPWILEPGDVLLVQPANLESPVRLPGDQTIMPDGNIALGRFGKLSVAGKTVDQVQLEATALIKAQAPDAGPIIVRLVTRESKVFYVLGEVNAPGAFPLRGRETALDALIIAGGLNSNASRRSIILTRPTAPGSCRVVLPVQYNEIVQLGDTTTNYQIRAGDRLFVPSKTIWDDLSGLFGDKGDGKGAGCANCETPPPVFP